MEAQVGLTASQKSFRKNVIGGSDANIIMSGNADDIYRLWQQKRGEIEPENLDDVLPVRMGQWTEPFNRIWFYERTRRVVTSYGEERLSLDHPWMASTLDGLTDEYETVWEAKHVNAFAREPEVLEKYQPQLHHNMIVCGLKRACLSAFFGNLKHVYWDVEFDDDYARELLRAEGAFWLAVKTGEPPVAVDVTTPGEKAAKRTLTLDMTNNGEWQELASEWLRLRPYSELFDEITDGIKRMIDVDVLTAHGHGIMVKADKANRLSIKPIEGKKPKGKS